MIRPERVLLRRLRRLLRPPVAMRLHVGRSDEGDPADDLTRGRPQCHHGDALHDARLRPRPPAQLALEPELAVVLRAQLFKINLRRYLCVRLVANSANVSMCL